jgi:hypothetical protein
LVEAYKVKVIYSPDRFRVVKGKPHFTKKGKPVECGEDGVWRLKE